MYTLIFLLVVSSSNAQSPPTRDCFQYHMKEAVVRNIERKQSYADLTNGWSKRITLLMINIERATLPIAKRFDDRARYFQEQGIPIICDELVAPMVHAPVFKAYTPLQGEVPEWFTSAGGKQIKKRLLAAFKEKGAAKLIPELDVEINKLAKTPSFHCLLRNEMRAIRRVAQLIPVHEEQAARLGIESPRGISEDLIDTWLKALPFADWVDSQVFWMQKQGVAMICQDFPFSSEL